MLILIRQIQPYSFQNPSAKIPVKGIHMKKEKEKDETLQTDGHINGEKVQTDQL